jgi:hypothetical protein
MNRVRIRGYPGISRIFAVISVITPSPNMRMPATAVAQSKIYCCELASDYWIESCSAYSKRKSDLNSTLELVRVSHVSVDIWEYRVATPRRHEKAK